MSASQGTVDQEEADLARAIALSLVNSNGSSGQSKGKGREAAIVILDSDDEQEHATAAPTAGSAVIDDKDHDSSTTELSEEEDAPTPPPPQPSSLTRKRGRDVSPAGPTKKRVHTHSSSTMADAVPPEEIQNSAPAASERAPAMLDRAAMERERLARQAARLAALPPSTSSNPAKFARADSGAIPATSGLPTSSNPTADRVKRIATLADLAERQGDKPSASTSTLEPEPDPFGLGLSVSGGGKSGGFMTLAKLTKRDRKFWKGVVKPTSSDAYSDDSLSFADVLGDTSELESALLTTFCGTPEWIHSHFPETTKIALVMPYMRDRDVEIVQLAPNMRIINPRKEGAGRGVMHVKLMLLFYKKYLRVAVSTANFIDYDWAKIDNAVYVHDFPLMTDESVATSERPFLKTLRRCHRSLGTPKALYHDALERYDFTETKKVKLVLSTPGTHTTHRTLSENGHLGLCAAIQALDLETPFNNARLELECQGSSIGSYTNDWMRTFYRSCMGWDPASPAGNEYRGSESARKRFPRHLLSANGGWPEESVKIVYPTFRTVKNSLNGPAGGGTIFCPLSYWNKPTFPKRMFWDSVSKRKGMLQHTKMILGIVRPAEPAPPAPFEKAKPAEDSEEEVTEFEPFGWLYVGSHNFTPGAWGRYSEKTGSLNIANHELGVLIRLGEGDEMEKRANELVTWKRPLQRYRSDDTPWDQTKYGR